MEFLSPLVSVITTAFNREKYIRSAIESILRSTYTNFELIIVDDNSTDRTLEIAHEFGRLDPRVRVFKNEVNLGDFPNRNKAASYACGKYLKYVDSDDLIYPTGLEIMVKTMEDFPEAGYGFCTVPPDFQRIFPFKLSPKETYEYHYFRQPIFSRSPLSAIFLKSVFEQVGGFPEKRLLGDFELWLILALKYPVVLMQQGLTWYRKHDSQEMNDFPKYADAHKALAIQYVKDSRCPMDDRLKTVVSQKLQQMR